MTVEDCIKLSNSELATLPPACDRILSKALSSGVIEKINRRGSRASQSPWTASAGHDKKKFYYARNGVDNPVLQKSIDEIHFDKKSAAYKEKVKHLRTRMSVRGAKNIPGVDNDQVQKLREAELQKRKSRRNDIKMNPNYA